MKNLFKNLMLVAVAAMAFTACSQDVNEVNNVDRVTRYEFTANIADDTRSGFAEKEEGATAYKSEWFGDEELKLFLSTNEGWSAEITAEINTKGQFSFELENAPESFYMTVCSPAESWSSMYSSTIPTEQTPLATSVDPKAHLLQSQATYIQTGSESISMSPQYACYGKMTVNAPADFVINKVEVSFNGGTVYTLNATHVENNVFWFAVDSMIDVTTFTVTAYDAENNAVTKTVDVAAAGKTLKFQWGHVSTFSVSGLEAVVAPEEPKALVFTSASWTNTWAPSDKFIQFYSDEIGTLQLNFYNCNEENYLDARTYGFASSGDIYPGGQYSWYENTAGIDTEIVGGTVIVSVVDGQYYIEFKNLSDYSAVQIESATFTGKISGLVVPDMRTKLAAPTATATADGNVITISWNKVTGADEYYVFCHVGGLDAVTTTETSVTIEAAYSTKYDFLIRAVANDSNADYRTSDDYYFSVTTGRDPDKFADIEATSISWSNSGYFTLKVPGFSYFYLAVPNDNHPGNNSLNVGDYTFGTNVNQFRIRYNNGTLYSWGDHDSNLTTMSVNFVDNQYVILINVHSLYGGYSGSIGYKGMPDGWVVPANLGDSGEGGDEPVDPTPTPDQPTESYSHVFTSCKCVNNMDMGEGWGAKFELSNDEGLFLWLWVIQTSVNQSTGAIATGTYNFHNQWCDMATQPGFVVKKMRLPGHGDEEFGLIGATFKSTLNGSVNDLEFVVTFEDNSTETYTFNGTVQRAW